MVGVPVLGRLSGLIPRYYLFRVTNTSGFFLPVAVIILHHKGFGLDFVGLAYGVYALAKLVVEVPTGYVGDWLGRRTSLALGSAVRAVVLGVYPFVDSAAVYLGVHVLWAVGRAFRSGTQDAWLYEILQARFDAADFARVESKGNTLKLFADAATALAGGFLYEFAPASPFVGTAVVAAAGIPLLLSLPQTEELAAEGQPEPASTKTLAVSEAVGTLRTQLVRPGVRWFVVYASLFSTLFVVTRIYEQPALDAVGVPVTGFGVLYAGFKLVSAGVASSVGRIHDYLGTRGVMLSLIPVYAGTYATVLLAPMFVVPVLFLNRGLRTVTRPVAGQYLNDRLNDVGRATVLSGASMVTGLVGGVARVVAGEVTAVVGPVAFLPLAGVGLSTLGAVVWLLFSPVRARTGTHLGQSNPAGTSD